jgi:transposase
MIVSEGVREMPAAHPPEFRRRALDLVAQGNPVGQTARDLGISESCLRYWMNRDAVDSGRKAGVTSDEHKELVELRSRNRVLEMEIEIEIEILKRASASFARENALPK